MVGTASFSQQTRSVLAALLAEPSGWRHGYDIARETGLKSGTLYPILIRLAEQEEKHADRWSERIHLATGKAPDPAEVQRGLS